MLTPESVELATQELKAKTLGQIHYETAMLWLARAVAAHKMYLQTRQLRCLTDAEDYAHEALEHAALCHDKRPEDKAAVVHYIETTLLPLRMDLP